MIDEQALSRVITSHIGTNSEAHKQRLEGRLKIELVQQRTLTAENKRVIEVVMQY